MNQSPNGKDGLFCIFCQHTNQWRATHCQHCGAPLVAQDPQLETERKRQETIWGTNTYKAQYDKTLNSLPDGSLALFISSSAEPLIFPIVRNLILGRDAANTGEQMVDISQLSQLGHSVSRRHAVILPAAGGFTCSDLGSTNGTWLNQQMLEPGKIYQLQSGDQIRLGLLTVVVCFKAAHTAVKRLTILLKGRNTLDNHPHLLRPPYLLMQLSPFLQAVNELQEIVALSQGQPPRDIYIFEIHEKPNGIAINLELNPQTLHLLQRRLAPWRDQYTEFTIRDRKHPVTLLEQAIEELADNMIAALSPTRAAPANLRQRLEAALTILAVSPLEIARTQL